MSAMDAMMVSFAVDSLVVTNFHPAGGGSPFLLRACLFLLVGSVDGSQRCVTRDGVVSHCRNQLPTRTVLLSPSSSWILFLHSLTTSLSPIVGKFCIAKHQQPDQIDAADQIEMQ
jgi:hypothetical protein